MESIVDPLTRLKQLKSACIQVGTCPSDSQFSSFPTPSYKLADVRDSWLNFQLLNQHRDLVSLHHTCGSQNSHGGTANSQLRRLSLALFIPCLTSSLILPGVPTPRCTARFSSNFTCSWTYSKMEENKEKCDIEADYQSTFLIQMWPSSTVSDS